MPDIYLASASPRRLDLLRQIGIEPIVLAVPVEEATDLPPTELVCHNAEIKLLATIQELIASNISEAVVIAADTIVVLNGKILGKPKDRAAATQMLEALSGQAHQVLTGLAVGQINFGQLKQLKSHIETTTVYFNALTETEIKQYVLSGEPLDKAGAYGIQGLGALLVAKICGDYFNVVGLPLFALGQILKAMMPA